ncbi:hypothetical protein HaLaN_07523 [Haematococcus lacustris]|uniref:Uncharacterized protein n=1 Tax=Haematococcus lacustris TaxID=44745 RepID=A0A699YP81_HAELA|nr:hypothetical protein HaLaN_07523 [Haematococcus lacustris]
MFKRYHPGNHEFKDRKSIAPSPPWCVEFSLQAVVEMHANMVKVCLPRPSFRMLAAWPARDGLKSTLPPSAVSLRQYPCASEATTPH